MALFWKLMPVELQDWSSGGEGQFLFFFQLHIRPSFRIMPLAEQPIKIKSLKCKCDHHWHLG